MVPQALMDRVVAILPHGAEWKWFHPSDGLDPEIAEPGFQKRFSTLEYDDSKWKTARELDWLTGFGYGDPVAVPIGKPVAGDRNTAYFRARFHTDQEYRGLIFTCYRDDGVIIYLDGKEVARSNVLSDSEDTYEAMALKPVTSTAETARIIVRIPGGLSPGAQLQLIGPATIPRISAAEITRGLAALPRRRPDLRALQAGYASQDARYRQAIWQQFPAITVGFVRARDTDAISTRGFQLSITLPVFNRNRGNIAIEKVTRQKLHDAYAIRLTDAHADIEHILQGQKWLQRQHDQLARSVTTAAKAVEASGAASLHGDISGLDEVKLKTEWLDQRIQLLAIDLTLLEQQAMLQTLLGTS